MSFAIPLDQVDDETIMKWREKLWIKPVVSNVFNKESKAGVRIIRLVTYKDNHYVVIPYSWATRMYVVPEWKHKKIRVSWSINLLEHQTSIVEKAQDALQTRGTCFLRLRPGTGKTFITCYLFSVIGLLPVVLVRTTILAEQWYKSIMESLDGARVCIVGIKKKDWPEGYIEHSRPNIYICLHTRYNKMDESLRKKVGVIAVDEAHMFCNQTGWDAISAFPFARPIGCSATPTRSRDGMDKILTRIFGTERVTTEYEMQLKVMRLNTEFTAVREPNRNKPGVNWTKLYQSLIGNKKRNKMCVKLAKSLLRRGRKPLFVSNEKTHVEELHRLMTEAGIDCDYIHGDKKVYSDSSVIIGNSQLIGTGFDERTYCPNFSGRRIDTVVLVVSIGNPETLEQILGRGWRDKHPLAIILVDNDKTVNNHWKMALEYFQTLEYDTVFTENTGPVCDIATSDKSSIRVTLKKWYN